MFRVEFGFFLTEHGVFSDLVTLLGFFIWDFLLHFFGIEAVGGCCYLNYALKSLGLPGVDISLDFVSLKVAVISCKCHLHGICSCLIIAFGSSLEQENILSVQVTGACRCCRPLRMQVGKLQLMEFNCAAFYWSTAVVFMTFLLSFYWNHIISFCDAPWSHHVI